MKQLNTYLPPLIADGLGVLFLFWVTPPLLAQFSDKVFINSVIIGGFFALFCWAVVLIRRLQNGPGGIDLNRYKWWLVGLSLPFIFFVIWGIADVIGFLDSVLVINNALLDEAGATIYLLITPASWLTIGLIYSAILAFEMEQTAPRTTIRHFLYATLGLSGVNLMIAVVMAYWGVLWQRSAPAGSPVASLLWLLPLFLLLFGPPRLVYLARRPHWLPLLTFLGLMAFYAWQLANGLILPGAA